MQKRKVINIITLKDFYTEWNRLHILEITKGADKRNENLADWLEARILEAKESYYNTGNPIMEDKVYDKMEDYLKSLRPTSTVLQKVGV